MVMNTQTISEYSDNQRNTVLPRKTARTQRPPEIYIHRNILSSFYRQDQSKTEPLKHWWPV